MKFWPGCCCGTPYTVCGCTISTAETLVATFTQVSGTDWLGLVGASVPLTWGGGPPFWWAYEGNYGTACGGSTTRFKITLSTSCASELWIWNVASGTYCQGSAGGGGNLVNITGGSVVCSPLSMYAQYGDGFGNTVRVTFTE